MLKRILTITLGLLGLASISLAYPVTTNNGATVQIANDTSTGTVANEVVIYSTSNPARAILAPAGTTKGVVGIVGQGAGTTGSALIQMSGYANCVFDGGTTAGDFVSVSGSLAGHCTDAGASPTSSTFAQVSSTNSGPGTYSILLLGTAAGQALAPINQLPNQTGGYNAQGFTLSNLGAPAATNDALSEGHSIGAVTPAAGTFTTTNAILNPLSYSGSDLFAKINTAMASADCPSTGCTIDAGGHEGTNYAVATRIVISKPIHLRLSGNILYTGAGNAAGLIEFASGSDGSELNCSTPAVDQLDTVYNYGEGGSANYSTTNACDLAFEATSATGNPAIAIDSGVSRTYSHDLNIQGDSSIGDGVFNNGADGNRFERISFSHIRNSGTPSNPTGWAIDNTSAGVQNATITADNIIVGWAKGIFDARTTSGGQVGVRITGNIIVLTAGQQLFVNYLQAALIQGNQFLSMFPTANNVKKLEIGSGMNQNIVFQDNHSECDNQTGKTGIIELAIDSATAQRQIAIINNSLHGNANCIASSSDDPDHIIDWADATTASTQSLIYGNHLANALNGGIKLVAGAKVAGFDNDYLVGTNGETSCTTAPLGTGCLYISGSAFPPALNQVGGLAAFGPISASYGGHVSSLIGNGVAPTAGSGSVDTNSTDTAFRITGGTSPVTVTFGTAFANAPICTCDDETAALGACKVTTSTTAAVVTTTGTDNFSAICIGK